MLVGVTGAAGFIGIHLVRALRESGLDVVGVDNFADSESRYRKSEIESLCRLHNLDILDSEGVKSAFTDVSHVFHLAAETHVDTSLSDSISTVRTNALGTATILDVARDVKASVTYVSTDEVFGDLDLHGEEKFNETSQLNPSSPYSSSKAAGELLAGAWARSYDMKINVTNCGNNFGEHQSIKKFIPRTMALLADNKKPVLYGNGRNVRDWIHASDHASALVEVMKSGEGGKRYLIGAENPVSNLELLKKMLEISGKPANFYDSIFDRPGHDLRYEITPSEDLKVWGWAPKMPSVEDYLGTLWAHYRSRFEKGELQVDDVANRGLSA